MIAKLVTSIVVIFFLTACSPDQTPVDLEGTWESIDNPHSPIHMVATFEGNVLEIIMHIDDMEGLYWAGTAPETIVEDDSFSSMAFVETLELSLFGSSEENKHFLYEDNQLKFDMSIMGVGQTIRMEKVN